MSPHRSAGPQVIQGRFPGGRPTIVQPKPATAQRQVAAHVQEAIHRGAPAFYRHVAQRKAAQEARRQASTAQRFQSGTATPLPTTFHFAPSIGAPMPPPVQRKMEDFFGADFSDVRVHVHVGPQAQQIGALAFTRGSDLYFAPGQYMPHHSHGQRLLGHELAHVVQQRAGRVRNPFGGGVAVVQDPWLEAEAERMGARAAQMYAQVDKPKERKSRAGANSVGQKKGDVKKGFGFVDNRPEIIEMRGHNVGIQRMPAKFVARGQPGNASGGAAPAGPLSWFTISAGILPGPPITDSQLHALVNLIISRNLEPYYIQDTTLMIPPGKTKKAFFAVAFNGWVITVVLDSHGIASPGDTWIPGMHPTNPFARASKQTATDIWNNSWNAPVGTLPPLNRYPELMI